MKITIVAIYLYLCGVTTWAQIILPVFPDSLFTTYYHQRATLFRTLPKTTGDVIFIGNSITDGGEWGEMFNDIQIKNRGISGDITAGVLKRINEVAERKPSKVFIMIGVNDLARGLKPDSIVKNILLITRYLKQECPRTKLFVQSILPTNDVYKKFTGHTDKLVYIKNINDRLEKESLLHHYTYIHLYSSFCNKEGKLDVKFSNDGLHLTGEGYNLWKHLVFPLVYDLQTQPALLPLPKQLNWESGYFPLYKCRSILVRQSGLENESHLMKTILRLHGWDSQIKTEISENEISIELRLGRVESALLPNEAYKLTVSTDKILIVANTAHGLFNGIKTLQQLMRDGTMINACSITDWPSFSWRGYMIDVGRNYMSISLLKQQIEEMANYKLTILHFHATEDIAWRIAIQQYPQLVDPNNMLRNKGQYYTQEEIKELIDFCKERYITFVPEIDMPGHSDAFKRAFKVEMQSDSGLLYTKKILKEFCTTFDVPYLHIGGDEVKITNEKFIPEVTRYVESLGKKTIGWQPGGNFTKNTIRQLWMDDAKFSPAREMQSIDSRHLYLNHMDPLEAVVTIFNRRIGNKDRSDESMLGGTLCLWHDRSIGSESDIMEMNPVYPGMLAFAERSWIGGGQMGWVSNISDRDEIAFKNFENRLLDNKKQFFSRLSFPYFKQTDLQWQLIGPFENKGDVMTHFEIEESHTKDKDYTIYKTVTGGTVVLRHWWFPMVKGALELPIENTTWYAVSNIWSDVEDEKDFWVGFNNFSRSYATDTPLAGKWDNKGGIVWINGNIIDPPNWKRSGQKGSLEIPLVDEGYEFRPPTKIKLKKGWNQIVIKLPVASLSGIDWNNPVKWMFTFIELK